MSLTERHDSFGGPSPSLSYRSTGNSPDRSRAPILPSMSNILNPPPATRDHHVGPSVGGYYETSHTMFREPTWQPRDRSPIRSDLPQYNSPPPPPSSYYSKPPAELTSTSRPYAQDLASHYQPSQPIVQRRQFKKAKIERRGSSKDVISPKTLSPLQSRSLGPQANHSLSKDVGFERSQAFMSVDPSRSRIPIVSQNERSRSRFVSGNQSEAPRPRPPPTGPNYVLKMRQHPLAARACGFGERDRRVIDPPPILTMELSDPNPSASELAALKRERYAVVHCTLWCPQTDSDATAMPNTADKRQQRRLMGTLVSSPFSGRDENNRDGCFFTFPDLSVRTPGRYSLQFKLVILDPSQMGPGARSPVRSIIKSNAFNVFNAKDFKGMVASTPLAVTLKAQGCLISVKKGSAKSKAAGVKKGEEDEDEDDEEED